jgi:hypothetical protein
MSYTADSKELAFRAGREAALRGDEARPGCPISPKGKAYMRGYIAGAKENS